MVPNLKFAAVIAGTYKCSFMGCGTLVRFGSKHWRVEDQVQTMAHWEQSSKLVAALYQAIGNGDVVWIAHSYVHAEIASKRKCSPSDREATAYLIVCDNVFGQNCTLTCRVR